MRLKVASIGGDISEYPKKLQGVQLLPADSLLSPEEQDEKARNLLFDIDYESSKNEISLRITRSMDVLMSKMLERQVESSDHMLKVMYIQHSLTGALMLSLLALAVIIFTMVIFPLRRAVSSMSSAEKLGEEGAGEIQFLAQTYNRLYDQNRLAHEKLSYEATHDALTGLNNRAAYASALDGLTTDNARAALVLVDVDHFKSINDHYGHDMGDAAIKSVADALKEAFRDEDMVCRIGGDEFAVIMHNADPGLRSTIIDALENMTKKLADPRDEAPSITLSAGVAFTDLLAADADLFKSADLALYKVKNGGRNGLAFSYPAGVTELISFAPDPDRQNKEGTV
jgi:diguanylate cyclase (GGDEF)-like protein